LGGASVIALAWCGAAVAQSTPSATTPVTTRDDEVAEVIVFGRAERRIGVAVQASEGAVAGADLDVRPLLRTAELLEAVPGMIATQHSGSGKANQYFLRGFNLDHGTDFGLSVDGVPLNLRTHGHGQGYLDVGGLIPELVQRVDYRKGPYRADIGDFNLVGGAQISTRDRLEAPFALAEVGSYDWRRVLAAGSAEALGGEVLLAGEAKSYNGPWQLPEDLRHLSLFGKYSRGTPVGDLRVSLSIYDARWNPTEQIPERAIGALISDAYGALDFDLRGETRRKILTANLTGPEWRATAYAQRYDWSLISNFTFFLDDPVNGDQLEQSERLATYGGRLERRTSLGNSLNLNLGAEARHDDIDNIGLFQTVGGRRIRTRNEFGVRESSAAAFAEATWRPAEGVSLFGGLRADAYRFDVEGLGGDAWSGKVEDAILSPKLGASWEVADRIALYANYGQGFHSNDARGVTAPVDPAPGLVKGEGAEIGTRFERGALVATATLWRMEVDSELIYVGDAGSVEPSAASERSGYELTAFWRPLPGLAIDAVWTGSRARFVDSPGADRIPGSIERAGELGLAYIQPRWNLGARLRHLGEYALVEDGSRFAEPTTLFNLRAAWTPGPMELYGELLNVFDADSKDIQYLYESYLPEIDPEGPVEGLHSRAVEPRMIRVGLKARF
jgi:outer membrane receptor protein involved in Fe transport